MYVGVAGTISVTAPWLSRGDTSVHVDYVWRLYKGDLPKRYERIQYKPFIEQQGWAKPQAASKNPPLFYAIHAPVVGYLLDQGHWQLGIAAGRFINILIGIGCIFALSWGGWLFGGKQRMLHAIAVPALAILIFRFTRLNVDFALDCLLVLLATLSTIFSYKLIKLGPSKKYISLLALVSVAGMLTKVSFVVFLATNLLAVFIAFVFHQKNDTRKAVMRGIAAVAAILGLVVVATGWHYYLSNYKVSGGNWVNAVPSGFHGPGREVKSFTDVITSVELRGLFYDNYLRNSTLSLFITGFAVAGVLSIWDRTPIKNITKDKALLLGWGIMFLGLLGTFLTQLQHAVGTGSISFRYMLPSLLPFGLFLSYGLLQIKWARGQIAAATAILMGLFSLAAFADQSKTFFANGLLNRLYGGIFTAAHANDVSSLVVCLLFIMFFMGCVMLASSLYVLSSGKLRLAK